MKIGKYIIIHEREYPAFQKAHRLARTMTEIQIEDILAKRSHLQKYPSRKLRVIAADKCQIETERVA